MVFVGGIALHLMTYHIDQSVSFGNRCLWFRVRKGQSQKSENHRALGGGGISGSLDLENGTKTSIKTVSYLTAVSFSARYMETFLFSSKLFMLIQRPSCQTSASVQLSHDDSSSFDMMTPQTRCRQQQPPQIRTNLFSATPVIGDARSAGYHHNKQTCQNQIAHPTINNNRP